LRSIGDVGFETALVTIPALVLSALLTGAARKVALSYGVVDLPNERSSHTSATPRGGGVSIVLVVSAAVAVLGLLDSLESSLVLAVGGGGTAVAIVGFLDDRYAVPARVRLAVHFGAAIWAVICLGGLPPLRIGSHLVALGWAGHALAVLGIVWALNLFNFMDGIDGIAASEGIFVAGFGSLLAAAAEVGHTGVPRVGFVLAGACAGFLLWNWPPAKIFMGDVGSGYLGYVIAALALAATRENPAAPWVWLTLGAVFFVDATLTLVRRLIRGERVYEAHRSHAYQWLARRWGSHQRVTVVVMMVNLIWLLPCAFLATLHPDHAVAIVVVALVPLIALAIAAGSGRRENANKTPMM
jgi:Fuc2NAc and GlcNAc transferase